MKAFKIICNILIGIILFGLIFSLTIVRSTKKFLEKDVIMTIIKEKITETVREGSGKLTDKGEQLLDDMLNDDDVSDVIHMVIDNFDSYKENKSHFKVSDKDVEKIITYANKYKNSIVEISGKKIRELSDEEFKKIFSSENINSIANEIYGSMDGNVGEGINLAIKIYDIATSDTVLIILISSIAFFIILLFLINWSLYKWMIVTGVATVVSGFFISSIYLAGLFFKDLITSSHTLEKIMGGINLNGYLIWGVSELVLGITLIVIYSIINNKKDETFKQLDNL